MTRSKWDSDLINSQQAEIERMQSFKDELIKILDWFSEHLPNEYHGFHSDRNLQGETTSEMVITTITDLRFENDQLKEKLRYALAAIDAVEWVGNGEYEYFYSCPWCKAKYLVTGKHKPDCQRQLVLQMLPLEVGER